MGAAFRPHEHHTIRIGSGAFVFRTFAFAEVFYADKKLRAVWRALKAAEADPKAADGVEPALRGLFAVVCPEMGKDAHPCDAPGCEIEDPHPPYLHLTAADYKALVDFYMRQDWKRLQFLCQLGDSIASSDALPALPGDPVPREERVFLLICAAVARFFNMSTVDYATLRFEDAADMWVAMYQSRQEGGKKQLTAEEAFEALVGDLGGGRTQAVAGTGPIATKRPDA